MLAALAAFRQIPIRLADIDLGEALRIATFHRIYAYDAFVLECARRYRAPLLSLDRRQLEIAAAEEIDILPVDP